MKFASVSLKQTGLQYCTSPDDQPCGKPTITITTRPVPPLGNERIRPRPRSHILRPQCCVLLAPSSKGQLSYIARGPSFSIAQLLRRFERSKRSGAQTSLPLLPATRISRVIRNSATFRLYNNHECYIRRLGIIGAIGHGPP